MEKMFRCWHENSYNLSAPCFCFLKVSKLINSQTPFEWPHWRSVESPPSTHLPEFLTGNLFELRRVAALILSLVLALLPLFLQVVRNTAAEAERTSHRGCDFESESPTEPFQCLCCASYPALARALGPQNACGFSWKRVRWSFRDWGLASSRTVKQASMLFSPWHANNTNMTCQCAEYVQ